MDLIKKLGLVCIVFTLNGCTVLGFATDMAIIGVSERNTKPGEQSYIDNSELYFTQEGIKHDVEAVKTFMEGVSGSQNGFTSENQQDTQLQSLTCKNIKAGKQQCYSAEYYADMYINDANKQAEKAQSSTSR